MLKEKIDKIKNSKGSGVGPFVNSIKNRKELIKEIESLTSFLDEEYGEVSLSQRIYHLIFDSGIERCDCGSPKKFNKNNRLSAERNKINSNYYSHCEDIGCLVKKFKETTSGKKAYGALIYQIQTFEDFRINLEEKTSFLDLHYETIRISQRLYHVFFNYYEIEKCPVCLNPRKFSTTKGFSEIREKRGFNYWIVCSNKKCMAIHSQKIFKESLLEKYGVDNQWKIPGYRESIEKTNLKKYGSKYFAGTKEFKKKCQETYDRDWGGKHPTSHNSVQKKKGETNLEKYGYACALNNPEINDKHTRSCYKTKKYTMPSGKIVYFQGYENFALDRILKEGTDENDIVVGRGEIYKSIGDFKYILNGKERLYFPDIYLKNLNKVIEVKSKYTYELDLEINSLKKESIEKSGIQFEFWIFSDSTKDLTILK